MRAEHKTVTVVEMTLTLSLEDAAKLCGALYRRDYDGKLPEPELRELWSTLSSEVDKIRTEMSG